MLTNYLPKPLDSCPSGCVASVKGAENRKVIIVSCSCDSLHRNFFKKKQRKLLTYGISWDILHTTLTSIEDDQ